MTAPRAPLAILLPPSEGKAPGGHGPAWAPSDGRFGASLEDQRTAIVAALAAAGGGDAKLLGVGGAHLTRGQSANSSLRGAPTMPAGKRYSGVVWDHLALNSLTATARRRAGETIVVFSGLLGLVAITDPIPDYRLKVGASLDPLGKLTRWWREPLSAALNDWLAGRFVVDLLTKEHRAAWTPTPERYAGGVVVTLLERSGRSAGHDAKAAKGHLASHLLSSRSAPQRALRAWTDDRFVLRLDPLS
ncbi:MAG: peroxide stress protein YaaA [Ilumatobacteraceae bacterium]